MAAVMSAAVSVPSMPPVVFCAGYRSDCAADDSALCSSITATYDCTDQGACRSALDAFPQDSASLGIADRDNNECC